MSFLSDLIALPVRILNVPAKVIEKLVDPDDEMDDEDKFLSKPLDAIADELEKAIDPKKRKK